MFDPDALFSVFDETVSAPPAKPSSHGSRKRSAAHDESSNDDEAGAAGGGKHGDSDSVNHDGKKARLDGDDDGSSDEGEGVEPMRIDGDGSGKSSGKSEGKSKSKGKDKSKTASPHGAPSSSASAPSAPSAASSLSASASSSSSSTAATSARSALATAAATTPSPTTTSTLAKSSAAADNNGPASDNDDAGSGDDETTGRDAQSEKDAMETATATKIVNVEITDRVTHEVAVLYDSEYKGLLDARMPAKPAKEYPFTLDPFQREAVKCLEHHESVLVSAHTSAGKTVVAEYAIAMSFRDKQRVIYTTPIKALSNQKYRELNEEFGDVGLMTGDVTISPGASCLVMTTEILRSMLYRGSEIMREVAWVIFDEVHYMRDKERGVVWEETMILLPDNVHYVFLSATIPNAREFAQWICHLHRQPCHVVYTNFRPTPLQHYIFPAGGDGLFLIVDEKGDFREDNFAKSMAILSDSPEAAALASSGGGGGPRGKNKNGGSKGGPSDIYKIVKVIMEKSYQPVIVFSFSKRECEAYALQMAKLDFNTDEEKKLVDEVFSNAIDGLSEDDRKLPQVDNILPLLRRGIGIHHSGLLPILKEVIEILFQEGLLKALFATETFSMGLNMPAKTVVFTSVRKFDGKDFRWISSGEYIQMSGRAGRRGLDDRGIAILMVDEKMEPSVAKGLLKGEADPLNSAFHLSYNMILNLLRVEEINPEYMLKRSFYQFQNNAAIPALEQKLRKLERERSAVRIPDEEQVADYFQLRQQLEKLRGELKAIVIQPEHVLKFIQPGRLAQIKVDGVDWGWGSIVNYHKKAVNAKGKAAAIDGSDAVVVVDMLLPCSLDAKGKPGPVKSANEKYEMQVVPVLLEKIDALSSVRIYLAKDLKGADNRLAADKSIKQVKARFPDGIPLLDPIEDMNIKDENARKTIKHIESLEHRMYSSPIHKDPRLQQLFDLYIQKNELAGEIRGVKKQIKQSQTVLQMDELKCRKRVLRRLGFCSAADVVELKGRVACEISSADELLITEMIFNGSFNELTVEQVVALLSCFVFQEKAESSGSLKEELAGPLRQMQDAARRIAEVSQDSKLALDKEEYVESFRSEMMDVVFAWSKGAKFLQICKMTEVYEGSIIRCMRRLEELLRQMCQAAKSIGNTELENKLASGISLIKRDIVFAASLYL